MQVYGMEGALSISRIRITIEQRSELFAPVDKTRRSDRQTRKRCRAVLGHCEKRTHRSVRLEPKSPGLSYDST